MAQKLEVTLTDDLDGSSADQTVSFTLDDIGYQIDLSHAHAEELRTLLGPYVQAGRKISARRQARKPAGATPGRPSPQQVRQWARNHGIDLPARGRIPADVHARYQAAQHPGQ